MIYEKDWRKYPLSALTSKIGSGSTPKGGRETYALSGIPFIRSMNVGMRQFRWGGLVYIDQATHEAMSGTHVQPNDVLLNITGASIGRVACAPSDLLEANVNQHVAIIRPTEDLHPRYLMYWLSLPEIQEFILGTQKGATRQALTKAQIEEFKIPLPPLSEQRRIVARIDALAARIEEARGLRRAAVEEAGAIVDSARTRLIGEDITGWVPLRHYVEEIENGWSPACEHRPAGVDEWGVLKLGAVSFGVFDPTENKALPPTLEPEPKYEIRAGDFLMSRANTLELVGACALVEQTRPHLMLCDKIFRFIFRESPQANPGYLGHVLKSPALRTQIMRKASGTSQSMKNISKESVLDLLVPALSLEEQRRMVAYLDELQVKAEALRRLQAESAAELEALLPSVLDQAFRGAL